MVALLVSITFVIARRLGDFVTKDTLLRCRASYFEEVNPSLSNTLVGLAPSSL